ncbi:MAG: hypothetical protein QM648_05840 [Solirubrobacterales bacterium]
MTRFARSLFALALALAAVAALPAGATAIQISAPTMGAYFNTPDVTIEYSGVDAATCTLDGSIVSCNPTSYTAAAIAEGEHHFNVDGTFNMPPMCMMWDPIDPSICTGWMPPIPMPAGSASVTFTVDRTAPVITLSGGPADGAKTFDTSASIGIGASEGTPSCTLDGAAFACGATAELTRLGLGAHRLEVSATDQAGNVGMATRSFVVTLPPKILSAPKSVVIGKKLALKVQCPDGCTIGGVASGKRGKKIKFAVSVKAGASSVNVKFKSSVRRALNRALIDGPLKVVFTPVGGTGSKTVNLKTR